MSKLRLRNEKDWRHWEDLPSGVRRYWIRRAGREWGWQILYKEVVYDADTQLENTVRMWQEVYDNDGKLVEVHHKFPAETIDNYDNENRMRPKNSGFSGQ